MEILLNTEPKGDAYHALIDLVQGFATHAAFIRQFDSTSSDQRLEPLLTDLQEDLIRIDQISSWPGTDLAAGYVARRYLYPCSAHAIAVIKSAAGGLFDWTNPYMPDDLHFLSNERVVLGQIAHERHAWLELPDAAAERLLADPPPHLAELLARA